MPSPSGSTSAYGFPFPEETDIPDVPTWGQELAQAVENEFVAIAGTAWTTISAFTNGHSNNAGEGTTAYRIVNGVVWVRLFVNVGTIASAAFQLPSSCYPAAALFFVCSQAVTGGLIAADIDTAGHVIFFNVTGQPSLTTWVSGMLSYPVG